MAMLAMNSYVVNELIIKKNTRRMTECIAIQSLQNDFM